MHSHPVVKRARQLDEACPSLGKASFDVCSYQVLPMIASASASCLSINMRGLAGRLWLSAGQRDLFSVNPFLYMYYMYMYIDM